jgi:hypothetical protein
MNRRTFFQAAGALLATAAAPELWAPDRARVFSFAPSIVVVPDVAFLQEQLTIVMQRELNRLLAEGPVPYSTRGFVAIRDACEKQIRTWEAKGWLPSGTGFSVELNAPEEYRLIRQVEVKGTIHV